MIASQFVPFDELWTWFHNLTFPQGNWMFEYNAKIVQLFTAEFFEAAVLRIALLALFLAMCVYGLAMILKRMEARTAAKSVTAAGSHQTRAHSQDSTPLSQPGPITPPPVTVPTTAPPQSSSRKPLSTEPSEPPEAVLELQRTAKRHLEEK